MRRVSVRAVIFDWGGTLTPWHQVDLAGLWHEVFAQHLTGEQAAHAAAAIHAAERDLWELAGQDQSPRLPKPDLDLRQEPALADPRFPGDHQRTAGSLLGAAHQPLERLKL